MKVVLAQSGRYRQLKALDLVDSLFAAVIIGVDAGLKAHDEEGAFVEAIERLLGKAEIRPLRLLCLPKD